MRPDKRTPERLYRKGLLKWARRLAFMVAYGMTEEEIKKWSDDRYYSQSRE